MFKFSIIILFLFLSCAEKTPKDEYFDAIKEYKEYLDKMDSFYIEHNKKKTYSDNIAIVNRYYSLILRCNKFTKKISVKVPIWKEIFRKEHLKFYIPDSFTRPEKEYDKINIELNRKLSVIIPRIKARFLRKLRRKSKRADSKIGSSVAKFRSGGEELKKNPVFYERNSYPERTLVHQVHRRYFR